MRDIGFRTRLHGTGLVLALVCPLIQGACDSAPPDRAPATAEADEEETGENPYLNADDLCALVPLQDVVAAAGGTEPTRSEAGTVPPASCDYFFDVPDPYGARQAGAALQMLDGFGLEKMGAGDAAQDIPGLGDEAWAKPFTDSYLLYARRGDLVFSVNVSGVRDEGRAATARAVAEVVLAALAPG
jgi:hypothetical protein